VNFVIVLSARKQNTHLVFFLCIFLLPAVFFLSSLMILVLPFAMSLFFSSKSSRKCRVFTPIFLRVHLHVCLICFHSSSANVNEPFRLTEIRNTIFTELNAKWNFINVCPSVIYRTYWFLNKRRFNLKKVSPGKNCNIKNDNPF